MLKNDAEFRKKLESILHIFILAQDAYLYTEYFHNPATDEEKKLVYRSHQSVYIKFIMHLMFRSLIVEVSKLYRKDNKKREKFSLPHLVDSLLPGGQLQEAEISRVLLSKWINQFNENQETINAVLRLRDKVYAHSDDPLKSYNDIDLQFAQLKELLDLAGNILKELYGAVYDTSLELDSPTFDRERFGFLRLLSNGESNRIANIIEQYRVEG
ncbi:MAG: hypothetical protein EOP48_27835 [Sphingobacteriales bacterium]|nr:MAG: hypothetical protein EOP48_27835 [Sphingobacteriales bacterium]